MKNVKKTLTELMGYEPSRSQILMILQEMKSTGRCLEEVADKFALPEMFILHDKDSLLDYHGEKITIEEFKRRFPYRRFITMTGRNTNK